MAHTNVNSSYHVDIDLVAGNYGICDELVTATGNDLKQTSNLIAFYSSLVLVLVGLLGNICMTVFSSSKIHGRYLFILAVSHSMYLISVMLTKVLTAFRCVYFPRRNLDFYNHNDIMCKMMQFAVNFFSDGSTCLMLAFVIERFILVYFPGHFKKLCTLRAARMVCVFVVMLVFCSIMPHHLMHVGLPEGLHICTILPAHQRMHNIMSAVEKMSFGVFPILLIAVCNICIVIRMKDFVRQNCHHKACAYSARSSKLVFNHHEHCPVSNTVTLVILSTTYVIAYIPVIIHRTMTMLMSSATLTSNAHVMSEFEFYSRALYIAGFPMGYLSYMFFLKVKVTIRCSQFYTSPTMPAKHETHHRLQVLVVNSDPTATRVWFKRHHKETIMFV